MPLSYSEVISKPLADTYTLLITTPHFNLLGRGADPGNETVHCCGQRLQQMTTVVQQACLWVPSNHISPSVMVSLNFHTCVQALLLYLISPAAPNKPPQVPPDISWAGLDLDHLLLQAGLISAGMHAAKGLYASIYMCCHVNMFEQGSASVTSLHVLLGVHVIVGMHVLGDAHVPEGIHLCRHMC